MRYAIPILFLLACITTEIYAQDSSTTAPIIYLEPVTVRTKNKKAKTVKVTYRGEKAARKKVHVSYLKHHISPVNDLPAGKLKSVSFWFYTFNGDKKWNNDTIRAQYKYDYNYKWGIKIYEQNELGELGKCLSNNTITFTVPAGYTGKYKVDLSPLQLESQNLYIGLDNINNHKGQSTLALGWYRDSSLCSYYAHLLASLLDTPNLNFTLPNELVIFQWLEHLQMEIEVELATN